MKIYCSKKNFQTLITLRNNDAPLPAQGCLPIRPPLARLPGGQEVRMCSLHSFALVAINL